MHAKNMSGAQCLVAALEAMEAEAVFGVPGGALLAPGGMMMESTRIRVVPTCHDQGAGHAAEGYALATGRVGVCIAARPSGATNLVTPLADALMDSVPIVAITGPSNLRETAAAALHEADIWGVTMPITKHNFRIAAPQEIAPTIARAFRIASTGRPGPVLVDIAASALTGRAPGPVEIARPLPILQEAAPARRSIRAAARAIADARRPVLYVGGGVIRAKAARELRALVDINGIPVVTTLTARGALPDSHPRNLGMPGMHGTVPAVAALQLSDLVIAVGARFDDRVTGDASTFAQNARVIHIDIDPAEIGKNRTVDIPIVADCRDALTLLADELRGLSDRAELSAWHQRLDDLSARYPIDSEQPSNGTLGPQYVMQRLSALVGGPDTIFTSGVGQHQMWASQFISFDEPSTWLTSGGLGTMGFGVPAAMGAKIGRPDTCVWCIDGDGCFQMTGRELAACASERIPVKVALINNRSLGMVRQLQTLYFDDRVNNVHLSSVRDADRVPDFVKLADALGCVGLSCEHPDEVDNVIAKAMSVDDVPVVVDFRVDAETLVWPSIAAGASNDDVQYARGLAPSFSTED